jgi:threonylcarbamoyladenosine tRNA methylthiotransferase MtaB
MRTIKFYTLGCKVNQYDTQSIRERFIGSGFREINNGRKADIYVINTCTVTQHADSESLKLMRRAKRENPKAKIVVTGCLAELDRDKIKKESGATLIVRNKDKNRILKLLDENNEPNDPNNKGISNFSGHTRAFLKVQDGCDNFCSYCKVPLVRGASRSRPLREVILEAGRLSANGFKEIVLSGICLGSYARDLSGGITLVDVIEALEGIEGLARIRLSSIEAGDVSDKLIDKMAHSRKLCRHLHIPIQSGDSGILKKMNRRYTKDDYLNLIHKLKSRIPQVAVTTDVLVGFPGETEEAFRNTLDLIKKVSPLRTHIFPYSRRERTAAANFNSRFSSAIIAQRIKRLKGLAESCSLEYRRQLLNKDMQVLIEGRLRDNPDLWQGYSDNYIKVAVSSRRNLRNRLITVRLKEIDGDFIRADTASAG